MLAPSVTFVENIWRQFRPRMDDRAELRRMRLTVLVFSACVCAYAIFSEGTPIYDMVSGAYQVTLVGAFVPLAAGLYWKRATTQGAVSSIVLGVATWLFFLATDLGTHFPPQLAGVLLAVVGMVAGSLAPQQLADRRGSHHTLTGAAL
jgi:Na+/proline symporter